MRACAHSAGGVYGWTKNLLKSFNFSVPLNLLRQQRHLDNVKVVRIQLHHLSTRTYPASVFLNLQCWQFESFFGYSSWLHTIACVSISYCVEVPG